MKQRFLPLLAVVLLLFTTVSGVLAAWVYFVASTPAAAEPTVSLGKIRYGTLYITKVEAQDTHTTVTKSGDTNIRVETQAGAPQLTAQVTFYNSTDVSYYYDETTALSWNNNKVSFSVSGLSQKDEVPPKSRVTLTVTFSAAAAALLGELHFNFVVDKDSIGDVVALTAVDRFRDILNNVVSPDSYNTLDTAMNNQSGYNKASAVTYIGNVVGSSSDDSALIESLFGEEFISMDLDGDGKTEPITMMIKRENLDDNEATGGAYTYVNNNRYNTERGIEMTLYITAQSLSGIRNGASVDVYAATFTILPGGSEWVQVVPLTKGTASANNYNGSLFGSANSFNTDTWKANSGKTISQLMAENMDK